jgi:hypothetical protein
MAHCSRNGKKLFKKSVLPDWGKEFLACQNDARKDYKSI